jgi:S-DNA-T family DNA segregation ATPase FtsK/SpoIIIE
MMTYSLKTLNNEAAAGPTTTGWRRFAQEIALVTGFVGLVFCFISLASHNRLAPAWWLTTGLTDNRTGRAMTNWGGALGAWFSAMGFSLFGYSIWWLFLAGLKTWVGVFKQKLAPSQPTESHEWIDTRWAFWAGLVLLMFSSMGLEWTRLYRFDQVSYISGGSMGCATGQAGGWIGCALGQQAQKFMGFNGSGLVFIVFLLVGFSWVFRISWISLSEQIGESIEQFIQSRREKREIANDLAMGHMAAREREEVLQEERIEIEEQHVSPVIIVEPDVVDIPQSTRVARERQKPLFSDLPDSRLPQVDLLDTMAGRQDTVSPETLEMTSRLIEKKLKDFGVEVRVVAAAPGPVVTRYEIEPATGVKGSQIVNLAKDLARSLSLVSIRVVETIPGKNYMALELPNAKRQTIKLSEILGSQVYNDAKSMLTLGLGKDIVGNPVVADLAKMPHVLVAGTTGSGKSVGINGMILSLLYKAEARDVRLLMIDPKMLEMSVYEGIPHLLAPVVTDMKQAAYGLTWCVAEMERRYKLMSKLGVRNLAGYNTKIDEAGEREELIPNPFSLTPDEPEPLQRLPHIVVVIDELADLMMVVGKKIEELIARLAQKARAAGIHLILATQRPSVDVITGLIKANIPTRIAFQVSSKIDSRTILDQMGAEALLGMGDMLYMASGTGLPVRVHGAFVSDEEVHRVVSYLKTQGSPDYVEGVLEASNSDESGGLMGLDLLGDTGGEKDPLYDSAVEIVLKNRKASISLVQRHLKIGYNRSARLLEDMEKAGLVSSLSSNGQREILVPTRAE